MHSEERYRPGPAFEPGRLVRMIDEPVRVGNILWVLVDPHRGHEVAYNRWYERDHWIGGALVGAGLFAGKRWVATRRHKDARLVSEAWPFPADVGSYACTYLVDDDHADAWRVWSTEEAKALYLAGRGFQSRTHWNTGYFEARWRAHRDPDPVPLELALHHPYPGMIARFVSPTGDPDALDDWFDAELGDHLAGTPVATVAQFAWHADNPPTRPGPAAVGPGDTRMPYIPGDPDAATRRLQLCFVEADPLTVMDGERALAAALAASDVGRVDASLPFVATVPGTDTYTDELW